jgi:hypothetical protein
MHVQLTPVVQGQVEYSICPVKEDETKKPEEHDKRNTDNNIAASILVKSSINFIAGQLTSCVRFPLQLP